MLKSLNEEEHDGNNFSGYCIIFNQQNLCLTKKAKLHFQTQRQTFHY